VRVGHVVGPLGDAEHLLLDPARLVAEELLGRVGEDAQDELVILLLVLVQVLVGAIRVVVVGLRATASGRHLDELGRALRDGRHLGVEADLDTAVLERVLPVGVELGLLGEDDHRRLVARQALVVDRVP